MTAALGSEGPTAAGWLRALRRYIGFVAVAHLLWEFTHLPLYTIWLSGTPRELAFAALHCTGGDLLIALSAIMLALFLCGRSDWPMSGAWPVLVATIAFGVSYTIFSEWLNIEIRRAWAYRDLMPVIPIIDAGLSPLLQWVLIPLAAYAWALWPMRAHAITSGGAHD